MDDRMTMILKKRARRYAPPLEEKKERDTVGNFVGCRIGDARLALPSEVVVECAPLIHWTPFAGRKNLLGITHLRGDVMALLDLLQALTGKASGKCNSMAVLHSPSGRFAIPVTEVLGIREIDRTELLPPEQAPLTSPLLFGATHDLWFLVKQDALMSLAERI